MRSSIIVKTSFNAEHRYLDAPDEVKFLRDWHPHVFNVEAEIEVPSLNRSLEFFMVKREMDKMIAKRFPKQFELSCEQIEKGIFEDLSLKYGVDRKYIVTVGEDYVNAGRYYGF
jgi:6-pyruvoyl-tetrahydropterin synthase